MESCAGAYCGNYSPDVIKSIKSTLLLDEEFNFNGANNELKKALMDAYLKKLQTEQADNGGSTAATISAGIGSSRYYIFTILLFYVFYYIHFHSN